MKRFDTVELKDGTTAMVLGVEVLLGKATGNVLVHPLDGDNPIVVNSDTLKGLRQYVKPTAYPHIDDERY